MPNCHLLPLTANCHGDSTANCHHPFRGGSNGSNTRIWQWFKINNYPIEREKMTKPISAGEQGLRPHYKVRVVLPGAILHVASWDEPRLPSGF